MSGLAEPTFLHERCELCVYLGQFRDESGVYLVADLWFCDFVPDTPVVIGVYGDGQGAQELAVEGAKSDLPWHSEAVARAKKEGLI